MSSSSDSMSNSGHPLSSSTPLGIVPEKAALAHQIRRTVPAQYWGLSVASASAPDAALASSVSEPAPLPLLAGSGLSRPHLVLATQAVKLPGRPSLPGLPSVCHDQGGVVLDRILAHSGGDSWWAALSGRARLGRLVAHRADLLAAAADPRSYSLCGTSRVQLSRNTVLRSRLDLFPPATSASAPDSASTASRRRTPRDGTPATTATSPAGWAAPMSLSCQLQSRVGRWAEARADLSLGHRTAAPAGGGSAGGGNGGGGAAATTTTPLLLGLQAGSVATSRAPLVWRCGLLQVTAPPTVPLPGSDGPAVAAAAAGGLGPALQSAAYVQGTVAIQGERVLWQAPKRPLHRRRRTEASVTAAADGAGPTVAAAASGSSLTPIGVTPAAPVARQAAAGSYHSHSRSSGDEDDDEDEDVGSGALVGGGATAGGKAPLRAGGGGKPFGIELPSAGAVQEALVDVTQSVSRLRDDVTAATQWVGGGGLVEQLEAVAAAAPGAAAPRRQAAAPSRPQPDGAAAQVPWSSFVGEPHVKVAGVAGLTARAPVIVLTHGSVAPGGGATLRPTRLAWIQDLWLKQVLRRRGRGADDGAPAAAAAAASAGSGSAVGPVVSRGALRPFASAAASVQAGRFSGWLFDFTRLSAQLDCGLWAPAAGARQGPGQVQGMGVGPGRQRHPAFALGDTGAWHALSLSLSQQLVGPLRFAADWRYELASSRPLALPPPPAAAARGAGAWLGGAAGAVAAHTVRMRPQLLEAVYALDLAVPGSRGAARLVAWYTPQRREGMVELRMF
ncbi:hypothetical protein PLESTB_000092700 [Pleodorina starrii]|uniref:Uncharacterized protein n=1 Tax=Pleodorina starrii TaxID=330485 RepID=A0A9W6BBA1_9CHLO|nr:hypothetical protein PLESTB_000092700 [Pleodorina starrii]